MDCTDATYTIYNSAGMTDIIAPDFNPVRGVGVK